MKETGYFLTQLDDTIRETEKLLKALNTVKRDCEHISIAFAIDDCMKVVRHAEKTALLARALPVYTYHPRPMALLHQTMEETIPIEIGFTKEGWFYLSMPILLPRKEKSSRNYIRDMIYPSQEEILDALFYENERSYGKGIFAYDAIRNEKYYLSFLDSNILRLFRFHKAALEREGTFVVACHQEQLPFLQTYFGDSAKFAVVNTEKLESILNIEKRDLIL